MIFPSINKFVMAVTVGVASIGAFVPRGVVMAANEMADFPDDHDRLAHFYAPTLRFDSKQDEYCFPDNAETHFTTCKFGTCTFPCNGDKGQIERGEIPTYYQMSECGDGVIIMYWWWYNRQDPCLGDTDFLARRGLVEDGGATVDDYGWNNQTHTPSIRGRGLSFRGDHDGDWERIIVKLNKHHHPEFVTYFQHSGHYTIPWGDVPKINNRNSIVYPGRSGHGSYHESACKGTLCLFGKCVKSSGCDRTVRGGCQYWEDIREGDGVAMNTWVNLKPIAKNGQESHMLEWDTVPGVWGKGIHPFLKKNLCDYKGCYGNDTGISAKARGCEKSALAPGDSISPPPQNDPYKLHGKYYFIRTKYQDLTWHANELGEGSVTTKHQTRDEYARFKFLYNADDQSYTIRVYGTGRNLHVDALGNQELSTKHQQSTDYTRFLLSKNDDDGTFTIRLKASNKRLHVNALAVNDQRVTTLHQADDQFTRFYLDMYARPCSTTSDCQDYHSCDVPYGSTDGVCVYVSFFLTLLVFLVCYIFDLFHSHVSFLPSVFAVATLNRICLRAVRRVRIVTTLSFLTDILLANNVQIMGHLPNGILRDATRVHSKAGAEWRSTTSVQMFHP